MSPAERPGAASGTPGAAGWVRALLIGLGASVLATVVLMVVPHLLLTHVPGVSRPVRVGLATTWTGLGLVAVCVAAWRASRPRGPS